MLSYNGIIQNIFYYYPIYCRTKIAKNKKHGFSWVPGELEVGYALHEMEDSMSHPAERLMLHTAGLILAAGREPEAARSAVVASILDLIEQYGINLLFAYLSDTDSKRVEEDLKLLGIL